MTTPIPRKFPLGAYLWWLAAVVVIGIWPVIALVLTMVMVPLFGCTRGIVSYTCATGGEGMGSLIGNMELSFWFFVVTAPVALFLFAIWLGVLVVHAMNNAGRSKAPAP